MTFNGRPVYYSIKMQFHIGGSEIVGIPIRDNDPLIKGLTNGICVAPLLDGNLYQQNIFLELATVNENDNTSILEFYNTFGSLLENENTDYENLRESLETIRTEIQIFKHVFMLHLSIQEKNWDEAKQHREYLKRHFPPLSVFDNEQPEDQQRLLKVVFSAVINKIIKDCTPSIQGKKTDNDSFEWEVTWSGKNLLTTLYLDFAMSISTNKRYRKCKSRNCREYFEVTDPRKEFCSMTCKNYENINRWRDNKKQKENTPAKPKEKDNKKQWQQ